MSETNQKNKAVIWDFWQRMNNAEPNQMPGLVKRTFHEDVNWNGPQPINHIRGADALITNFWEPLRRSFPDLRRCAHILMGGVRHERDGTNTGEYWVSGTGYLTGTFVNDWLDIPATRKKTNIYFGQFFLMRDYRVTESYVILDVLAVMKQAGFQVLPPAFGAEGGKLQKPFGDDGIMLTEQDELLGRQSEQMVRAMGAGMGRYIRSRDMENLESMDQQNYWHHDFHWMGPTGIGTSHNLEEYQDFHQRPWLIGFGDRADTRDFERRGGRGVGGFYEGNFYCGGIWDTQFSKHHGEYQGIPGSESRIMSMRDFDWWRCEGSAIVQNWVPIDMVDLFLQMGVDLFERMRRQHEYRERGIDWWDLPGDGSTAATATFAGRSRKS